MKIILKNLTKLTLFIFVLGLAGGLVSAQKSQAQSLAEFSVTLPTTSVNVPRDCLETPFKTLVYWEPNAYRGDGNKLTVGGPRILCHSRAVPYVNKSGERVELEGAKLYFISVGEEGTPRHCWASYKKVQVTQEGRAASHDPFEYTLLTGN